MNLLIVKKKYGKFQVGDNTFEGAKSANKCLPYDKVCLSKTGCILRERSDHPTLVGILETCGSKYGFTSHQHPIYLCKPIDSRYPPFYIGSKIVDRIKNKLIKFKFDSWPENSEFPKGVIIECIGNCGDILSEKKALIAYCSPYYWPKILNPIKPYIMNRNFIEGFTFNIDPEGCKDIDDCITLVDNSLIISIADVSEWFTLNPWMKFAENIGTSLYENGVCVKPMFPKLFSEDYFSLIQGKKRMAYSLIIQFGDKISWHFEETVVEVNISYTYENFPNNPLLNSYVERLTNIKTDDPHKIIEILMIYYNTKAGEVLKQKNCGIFRSQKGRNLELAKQFDPFGSDYMFLTYESAKYCLSSENTEHQQLNIQNYVHASSPIRRYVDIINQHALKGKILEFESVDRFNNQQKKAKQFERDLLIMDLLENKRILDGIVLDKYFIYVQYLKKIIKCENLFQPNQVVKLEYYLNPQNIKWKDKIIFNAFI